MIRIANPKDFWAGILFIALGAFVLIVALNYPMGSAGRMGPGYFPRVLGCILMALGVPTIISGLGSDGPKLGDWPWKALLFILGSVAMFAVILPYTGLVLAAFILIVLSGLAASDIKTLRLLIFAACMSVGVAFMFVYGLKQEIPIWPWSDY